MVEENKMAQFNQNSDLQKRIEAVEQSQGQLQQDLQETKTELTESQEQTDNNVQQIVQHTQDLSNDLESIQTSVEEELNKMLQKVNKVDEAKERQLTNLLQGIANLEDGQKNFNEEMREMKDQVKEVKMSTITPYKNTSQSTLHETEIKQSDIDNLRREFSDETSARCLEAVNQLKNQIDQEQSEKIMALEQSFNGFNEEKKRLERSVLKQTETLQTLQTKINDQIAKQKADSDSKVSALTDEMNKMCQSIESNLKSSLEHRDNESNRLMEKKVQQIESQFSDEIAKIEQELESNIQEVKRLIEKIPKQNSQSLTVGAGLW